MSVIHTLARDSENAARQLHDSQFARTILVFMAGIFLSIGLDQHAAIGVLFGLLAASGFLYWQYIEVPKYQTRYDEAQNRLLSAIWANTDRYNSGW